MKDSTISAMVIFFSIVFSIIAVASMVHSFRRNHSQWETLDSVAAVAGWQSRRRPTFLGGVSGSWRGYSVSMRVDEGEQTSLETRIRGETATKMVIGRRTRRQWWNPDILPAPEVRL